MENTTDFDVALDLEHLRGVPVSYITTTEAARAVFEELSHAERVAVDTETVARHVDGTLRDLDVEGPGALRVISIAAIFAHPDGPVKKAYVIDCATGVAIDSQVQSVYGTSDVCVEVDPTKLGDLVTEAFWFAWNADFDDKVLSPLGISPKQWLDLMLYQASLMLGSSGVVYYDSLSFAARTYLGVNLEGKGSIQLSYNATDPLSVDQVRYAAADAVATLDISEVLGALVSEAMLDDAVSLELRARPFRANMEIFGIPFDVPAWLGIVSEIQDGLDACKSRLTEMTGGGQQNLFDGAADLSWNPGSPVDVKRVLNQYATDAVHVYLKDATRLFKSSDSVDNTALQLLDHPIAKELLTYRELSKKISTYGAKFTAWVRADGRVHARYTQNVVSTGRLSSNKPNMQNLDPDMKPYFRPPNAPARDESGKWLIDPMSRVFVLGDLAQAELRYAAQLSGDANLLGAFARGDDMHSVAAENMFHVDMASLKANDQEAYGAARQKGKTMNFAVIYGLGATSLATTLTLAGIPTTKDEAGELLKLYMEAFPQLAIWLRARDAVITAIRENPPECDFVATMKLRSLYPKVEAARKSLYKTLDRAPTNREIALEITPENEIIEDLTKPKTETSPGHTPDAEEVECEILRRSEKVRWAATFHTPVVVLKNGEPFSFESRTTVGRRRIFNVNAKKWALSIIVSVASSRRPSETKWRQSFEKASEINLSANGRTLRKAEIEKIFEDTERARAFLSHILKNAGVDAEKLCYNALKDCVGALGNAFRNAPIQGGVADAVLYSYALLDDRLDDFEDAVPVQSVHDSIVIECYAKDALAVAGVLNTSMEEGLKYFCPDVVAKADVEVSASLDTKHDVIDVESLKALV
jgi:DNA polymerase I-like protein with 3'-5' exonuclease and polymerase domains